MNKLGKWKLRVGMALIFVSIGLFFTLFALPFLSIESKIKIVLAPVLLVAAEVMFWLGILLIGKDLYRKFKASIKSGAWWSKKRNTPQDSQNS